MSASSGSYEVRDLDDEQKDKKYSVRRSRMIPLPHWRADPQRDSHALFPVNAIVLALYPQTTCFYKVCYRVFVVGFEPVTYLLFTIPSLCSSLFHIYRRRFGALF